MDSARARRLVAIVCAAQVLVQIGAFFWPALLPTIMPLWSLTNSEAGWITAIFYGAYMVSVPVLVTLTDRFDPKRVYLFGVAATVSFARSKHSCPRVCRCYAIVASVVHTVCLVEKTVPVGKMGNSRRKALMI